MINEIGSEFCIGDNNLTNLKCEMPSWLSKYGNVVLTTSGRGAISLLLEQVNPKVKRVLLPSLICDSVILSFVKAGYELAFYDLNKNLSMINLESIKNFSIGIFYHMGYFGFSSNEIISDIIANLKSESIIIIEDVTHTLFTEQHKTVISDFYIGSIRKWFGIPSGGFLASDKIIKFELNDVNNEYIRLRKLSLQQKLDYMKSGNKSIKSIYLSGFNKAEKILEEDIKPYKIDQESKKIIENLDYIQLKFSRKRNYEFLLNHLVDVNGIEVIYKDLVQGVTPLFFPIYVKSNRDELRLKLIEKEIYCPIHWPIPDQIKGQLNRNTETIYNSILSIPCDQRYQIEDMRRIINEILRFIEE